MTVENTTQEPTIYSENEYTLKNGVRRLGFNPTSKGRKSKIELKKTA